VRLYVFDLGWLKSANPQPLLDRGVTVTDMSVAAYLIVHPRGTLLWDSGTIPDDQVRPEGTTVARATVHKTLSGQLAEIGYKPTDIAYLALSHYHYDHSANANQFAGSTWPCLASEYCISKLTLFSSIQDRRVALTVDHGMLQRACTSPRSIARLMSLPPG
jgi:glyoxylase-like metal-dependent hydrolase (beta-lactamase superfamily II)